MADCQLIFAPIRVEVSHHSAEYRIFGQSQLGTKLSAGDQQSSRIDPIVDDHEVGPYINALFLGKPGRQFFAQKHAGMDAWKDKSQNQSVLRAGIDSVQSQYPLDVGAARRQVHMQCFNRLVAVNHLDFSLGDNLTQLRSESQVDRHFAIQTQKLNARGAKIFFQIAAASSDKSQIEAVSAGISAQVERHDLGAAAIQRIQDVQDFGQVYDMSDKLQFVVVAEMVPCEN